MNFADGYCEFLDEINFDYERKVTDDGVEVVLFSVDTDVVKNVRIFAFFDGNAVSVHCANMCKVPDEKFADGLFVCNQLNVTYRFSKYYIDDNNEFHIQADGFLDENSAKDETYALVRTTLDKVDEAYAKMMKAIWA